MPWVAATAVSVAGSTASRSAPPRSTDSGREALAEWVRTPAPLPRIQNEPVVRLLAADLVEPENVREGLQAMRAGIDDALAGGGGGPQRRKLALVAAAVRKR